MVLRSRRQPRVPARRPYRAGDHPDAAPAARAAARPLHLPARRGRGPRVGGRQRPQPLLHDRRAGRHPRRQAAEGVLFAHGSRFGGHALYVKDNRLHYVYNFVGITEQRVVATEDAARPGTTCSCPPASTRPARNRRASRRAPCRSTTATTQGRRGPIKTQPGKFAIAGEGLNVGRDGGEPVTYDYPGTRRGPSPAARCTGSPSTSAASPTSTSSAKPSPCSPASESRASGPQSAVRARRTG